MYQLDFQSSRMTDVNDFSEECNPLIVTTNGDSHVINQEIDELANGQEINDHEVNGNQQNGDHDNKTKVALKTANLNIRLLKKSS